MPLLLFAESSTSSDWASAVVLLGLLVFFVFYIWMLNRDFTPKQRKQKAFCTCQKHEWSVNDNESIDAHIEETGHTVFLERTDLPTHD